MSDRIKVLTADEHRVGFSLTSTQVTFRKLQRLAGGPESTMGDWSAVVERLINKATS